MKLLASPGRAPQPTRPRAGALSTACRCSTCQSAPDAATLAARNRAYRRLALAILELDVASLADRLPALRSMEAGQ